MAIDASIYSQIRQPEPVNLLALAGQAQHLQGMQQQNRLAELAFQDRERSIADAAAQRDAVRGFGNDTTANYNRLLQTGNLGAAQGYQKGVLENQRYAAETAQKGVETGSKAFDLFKTQLATVQDPRQAAALVAAGYHDPVLGPLMQRFGTLEEGLQRLQQATATPETFAQWRANAAIGVEKLAQLAQVQNVNTGGQTITQSVQPATGQVTRLGAMQNTISPDAQLQADTSRANNTATVGAMRDNAQAVRDAANINNNFKNEAELRKEFEGLPEIKAYKQAYPAFASIKDAATRNTPQADINLVYGIAKLYDPNSVVREGEYATVANSPNIPEKIKGYAQYLAGGGKLSPETKRQILQEASSRVQAYRTEADKARATYENIAKSRGMNLATVLQATGDAPAGGVAPQAKPAAAPGGVMRFDAQGNPVP